MDILTKDKLETLSDDELKELYKSYKKKAGIQKNIEQAIKLLINSLYGYTGCQYSRFYNRYIAEAITLTGQALIRTSEIAVNEYLKSITGIEKDYVICIHTDSNYINLTDLVYSEKTKWHEKSKDEIITLLDRFIERGLSPVIDKYFKDYFEDTNAYDTCVEMKREAIGSGVFVQKARYTTYVYDNEGIRYATPELKIVGLEAIKSSTPSYFRDKMKDVYQLMYTGNQDKIYEYVEKAKEEFLNLPIEKIGKPSGISDIEKYENNSHELGNFMKGTPAHVKGALTYNRFIRNNNMVNEYGLIKSSDKVKLYDLKLPNHLKNNKIAVLGKIPPEFKLDRYVDRVAMFEDLFISPINRTLEVVGWEAIKTENLDDIFGF